MRWGVFIAALGLLAVVAAVAIGESSNSSDDQSDERAVSRVVTQGQEAVVSDRPKAVCQLLTRRARRNSLLLFNLGYHPDGRRRPKPTTCAQAVGYMIDDSSYLRKLRRGGAYYRTKVVELDANRALIRKRDIEIVLVRRKGHWFAHSGNFAPFDGSSGY